MNNIEKNKTTNVVARSIAKQPRAQLTEAQRASLSKEISTLVREALDFGAACKDVVDLLHNEVEAYDWTGVYMVDGDYLQTIYYRGDPTPHEKIKIGEGVCSLAVSREETVIIPDVSKEPVYLSCSGKTKSEIVVPLIKKGKVIGEIDIDSHTLDAFGENDKQLLEKAAYLLSRAFEK